MSGWILEIDVPYEGIMVEHYETAKEAFEASREYNPRDYCLKIRAYVPLYEPLEFKQMIDAGEVK